jgi:hypothetical protein
MCIFLLEGFEYFDLRLEIKSYHLRDRELSKQVLIPIRLSETPSYFSHSIDNLCIFIRSRKQDLPMARIWVTHAG